MILKVGIPPRPSGVKSHRSPRQQGRTWNKRDGILLSLPQLGSSKTPDTSIGFSSRARVSKSIDGSVQFRPAALMNTTNNKGRKPYPTRPCLTPGCEGKFGSGMPKGQAGGRGLCKSCFQQASSLVKRKVTTWDELENLGLAQPKYRSDYELRLIEARKRLQNPE